MSKETIERDVKGEVKFFVEGKGYGFISRDDGEDDVFFHATQITNGDSAKQGDRVTLDISQDRSRPRGKQEYAVNVVIL